MSPNDPTFAALLLASYRRLVGIGLAADAVDAAWLYHDAPFCVLAHDTSADPRFIYANRAAQACFEYGWNEMIGLPSRLSAEQPEQAERKRLLEAVARDGFVTGYRGIRIAKSGRRFHIDDAVIWNLVDDRGAQHGQAALIRSWTDV